MAEQESKKKLYVMIAGFAAIIAIILGLVAACSPKDGKDGTDGDGGTDGTDPTPPVEDGDDPLPPAPVEDDPLPTTPEIVTGRNLGIAYATIYGQEEIPVYGSEVIGWKVDPVYDTDGSTVITEGENYQIKKTGLYGTGATSPILDGADCRWVDAGNPLTEHSIIEGTFGFDTGYDYEATVASLEQWFTDDPTDPTVCTITEEKLFRKRINSDYIVEASLGKAYAVVDPATQAIYEISIDETKPQYNSNGDLEDVVKENYDHSKHIMGDSYRNLTAAEAQVHLDAYTLGTQWKQMDPNYMDGEWKASVDAIGAVFLNATVGTAEATRNQIIDGTIDWSSGVAGASANFAHVARYAHLYFQAISAAWNTPEVAPVA